MQFKYKALKCHRSNIKSQLQDLTQPEKRPINLRSACMCVSIREFLRTVLHFCLPNIRHIPVSYAHNCNKRSYCKRYRQEQKGHFGLRGFMKEADLRLLGKLTIDFPAQILDLKLGRWLSLSYIFFQTVFGFLKYLLCGKMFSSFTPLPLFFTWSETRYLHWYSSTQLSLSA